MPTSTPKTKSTASRLLENKDEADILYPKPVTFLWEGTAYNIKPMPDRVLAGLAEELARIMQLLAGLSEAGVGFNPLEMLPHFPEILQILLPNATRIVAACLGVDEEMIAENMRLGKKLECLKLIVEAEDLPLIVEIFGSLTGLFTRLQASAEPNAA